MFVNLPATVEGAKLQLTKEQEANCRVVYRKTQDEKGAYVADLWNPDTSYTDEFIIAPLRSVYDGLTDPLDIGTNFANVEGSSSPKPDPKHSVTSWIALIREVLSDPVESCCAEPDTIYIGDSQDAIVPTPEGKKDFTCHGILVGGHVILYAKNSRTVDEGGNVHLLPICNAHNVSSYNQRGTGGGYYMKLARQMKAVKLKEYMKLSELVER